MKKTYISPAAEILEYVELYGVMKETSGYIDDDSMLSKENAEASTDEDNLDNNPTFDIWDE